MPDQDFSISISADISDISEKLDEVKGQVEETAESMKSAGEEGGSGFSEAIRYGMSGRYGSRFGVRFGC